MLSIHVFICLIWLKPRGLGGFDCQLPANTCWGRELIFRSWFSVNPQGGGGVGWVYGLLVGETSWRSLPLIVTVCVNIICLSQSGSESPSLHLFPLWRKSSGPHTQPHPHWHHTHPNTGSRYHNSVVMWCGCVCMGWVGSLVSLLFAEGELWLHGRPRLTLYALSSFHRLSLHTNMHVHIILSTFASSNLKHTLTLCCGEQPRSWLGIFSSNT